MRTGSRPLYPFTAIVGQEQMKLALVLNAVHPALGGVLVRGRKGTAKSTAVRALAALLPEIETVRGCAYGCDPADAEPCDECVARRAAGEPLETYHRPVPVVELPVGATEDRVLGSLHLEEAIRAGVRRFEPGLLAQANRGILYVDEVNLLNDHLVDILLDAAAMGRNYVEREGVSVSHPARFMLAGTMNPEEGDLRPQLLDRFALAVEVEGLRDPIERAEAVRRRMAFEVDPAGFAAAWAKAEQAERERIARARALLPAVVMPEAMLELIVRVCAAFAVDGLRADLAMYRAATARAAYQGRAEVNAEDVRAAAELALPHRRRRQPFEQPGLDNEKLDEVLAETENRSQETSGGPDTPPPGAGAGPATAPGREQDAASGRDRTPSSPKARGEPGAKGGSRTHAPSDFHATPLPSARRRVSTRAATTRGAGNAAQQRGPTVWTAVPHGPPGELALMATLRAAAPEQPARRRRLTNPEHGPALLLEPDDLRARVRRGRPRRLVLFVVDASGSMGARDRMSATKGAVLSLLLDAYRKRDRVGMLAFRDTGAEVLLPPTNSVELAEERLHALPVGGRTPLAGGLRLAAAVIERARRSVDAEPLIVLISDVRPNMAPAGADPWRMALEAAAHIRAAGWEAIVIDTESGRAPLGLGRPLAAAMGAQHLKLDHLRAGHVEWAVRARFLD